MWLKKYLEKKKAQALFGTAKAKLEFLSEEYIGGRATQVDKKHWDEELDIMEQCVCVLGDKRETLDYYKVVYESYIKTINK